VFLVRFQRQGRQAVPHGHGQLVDLYLISLDLCFAFGDLVINFI
jgi:hypothetical protein